MFESSILLYGNWVCFKPIKGDSKSVENSMTASWTETELPATLSRYELNNLFHTDEFGLFFSMSARKKHLIWDLKSVQVVSKVRFARPEKLLQITSAKNFNYLQWEYQRVHVALKMSKAFIFATKTKKELGGGRILWGVSGRFMSWFWFKGPRHSTSGRQLSSSPYCWRSN